MVGNSKKMKENPLYPLIAVRLHAMMNRDGAGSIENDLQQEIKNFSIPRDVSSNSIREEFMKGWKSALDKQKYVHILGDLGLLQQIFRGLKVNDHPKIVDTKIPAVTLAQILEPNVPNFTSVREILIKLSYQETEANNVVFLLKLPYYNEHTAKEFHQDRLKSGISVKTLQQFAQSNGMKNSRWIVEQLNKQHPAPKFPEEEKPEQGKGQFQKLVNRLHDPTHNNF
jgi:hypothetical protein